MNRRTKMTLSIAGGAGTRATVRPAMPPGRAHGAATDESPERQAEITAGKSCIDTRCDAIAGAGRSIGVVTVES